MIGDTGFQTLYQKVVLYKTLLICKGGLGISSLDGKTEGQLYRGSSKVVWRFVALPGKRSGKLEFISSEI